MIALLRYAVVKSLREHLLTILVVAPSVLTSAPMLGMAVYSAMRGNASLYPFHIPAMSPEGTARLFASVTVVMSALVAAVGAFWIFRSEIASRAVNFFFLAAQPAAVTRAAAAYGFATGTLAYGLSRVLISLLTSSPPERPLRDVGIAVLSSLVGSALGSLLVALSAEVSILVAVYGGAALASLALLESPNVLRISIAIVCAVVLLQAAPAVLRWRCAS